MTNLIITATITETIVTLEASGLLEYTMRVFCADELVQTIVIKNNRRMALERFADMCAHLVYMNA